MDDGGVVAGLDAGIVVEAGAAALVDGAVDAADVEHVAVVGVGVVGAQGKVGAVRLAGPGQDASYGCGQKGQDC